MTTVEQHYILHVETCKRHNIKPSDWETYKREFDAVASVESVEPPEPPSARWERRNYSLTQFSGEGIHRRVKKGRVEEDPT
jgi:hypothetical protein